MVEPSSSTLPMLAAGQTATTDNANDVPIKRRGNFRRFPSSQVPKEGSRQGGHRPYRGRRQYDQPRHFDRNQESNQVGRSFDQEQSRNNVRDETRNDERTLSENGLNGARPRNESRGRDFHRFKRSGFRGGNRKEPRNDVTAANPENVTLHDDKARNEQTNDQYSRFNRSRNWPRVPRNLNHGSEYKDRNNENKIDAVQNNNCEPAGVQQRTFPSNRSRPYGTFRGRGRGRSFGNRWNGSRKTLENPEPSDSNVKAEGDSGKQEAQLPGKVFTVEEIKALRLREIQQFKTRFPKAISRAEDTFVFTFAPTDPEWAFDVRNLTLKVQFPAEYPSISFSIVVINRDEVLPPSLVSDVDNAIVKWVEFFHRPGTLAFRPFLRWLDRNLKEIFVESLRKLLKQREEERNAVRNEQSSNEDAAENLCTEEKTEQQIVEAWPMKALPKKQKRLEELDDLFDETVHPKTEVQKVSNHGPLGTNQLAKIFNNYDPHTPPRRGIEVKFRHVDFSESVSFIVCDRLLVSVQCKKCKKIADFQLLPGRRSVSHCAKCQTKLEACFGPSILLQFNPLLGYLELKDCTIRDVALSRCHFYADCQNCSKLSPLEGVHLGQRGSSHCLNCNLKMTFVMDSFKYMDLCSIEANIKASNLKKANKDSAIQAGKPLPTNGACKHYKKSFRWFRFPCCGKAYPCDVCHDVAEDHEAEFASRMICGFCAKEQPFCNDKPCSQCSSLITGRRTAHWEGGKGCRSQLKMNTNDTKKYAGLNKTVSRKSTAGKSK